MATEKSANMTGEDNIQRVASAQAEPSEDPFKHGQTKEADQAAQFLARIGPFPPMAPEQEKKLVRKIDRWMVPMVRPTTRSSIPLAAN